MKTQRSSPPPFPLLLVLLLPGFALLLSCDCAGGAETAPAEEAVMAARSYEGPVAALIAREPVAWFRLALQRLDESALMPELLAIIREGEPDATSTFEDVILLFHADGVQRPLVFSRGAFDRDALLNRLRSGSATQWGGFLLERDERFSVWVHPRGERAYALASPRLIVTGTPSRVREVVRRMNDLTAGDAPSQAEEGGEGWLETPHDLTLQIRMTDVVRVGLTERVGDPEVRAFLDLIERIRVGLDLPEGEEGMARVHLVVQAGNPSSAQVLAQILEQLLEPEFLRGADLEIPAPVATVLERAEISSVESVAHGQLALRPDELRLVSAMLAEVLEDQRRAPGSGRE